MRQMYYINPSIQKSFTTVFTFITVLELLLFGLFLTLLSYLNIFKLHDYKIYVNFGLILVLILLISGFNFWIGTRLSHRMVGPVVQITRTLDKAIGGKYDIRIKLRSKDFLHEVGDKVNLLLEQLENSPNTRSNQSKEIKNV